jgi:MOSC domain-containing protein
MQLTRIIIFPIKSLDGISVESARFTAGGILEKDRVFAIYDVDGKVVNGKRTARIHDLRDAFDPEIREVRLWQKDESPMQFQLDNLPPLEKWLSEFFGFPVVIRQESEKGFPDDREAFGPTIVSEASLLEIQSWFPGLTLESLRRRFRANLELLGEKPFCEDILFGAAGELKPFQVGEVKFFGHNPCQRCVVPTRDPDNGQGVTGFQKTFMEQRKKTLPEWSNAQRFNHFYRFAINTSVPPSEVGKQLRVGDEVTC